MATTKTVETDSPTTTVIERKSGGGMGVGLIVLAIVIIGLLAAYFMFSANREDRLRTDAVSSAASSVAGSASQAADSVSDAASAVTPAPVRPAQ
jgi:septal ring-binding cell division protein DamX